MTERKADRAEGVNYIHLYILYFQDHIKSPEERILQFDDVNKDADGRDFDVAFVWSNILSDLQRSHENPRK